MIRLSIPGNLCVHCGEIIGESVVCPGCGWTDPLTKQPPSQPMTDRVAPEELVPRWRAIITAQRQYITRLEGENERLRDRLETTAYLYHGCMCDDPVPSAFADCRTNICIDNRTALSHSAPKTP